MRRRAAIFVLAALCACTGRLLWGAVVGGPVAVDPGAARDARHVDDAVPAELGARRDKTTKGAPAKPEAASPEDTVGAASDERVEWKQLYESHGALSRYQQTFGPVAVRPLGLLRSEFRAWLSASDGRFLVEDRQAALERLASINIGTPVGLENMTFQALCYSLGGDVEVIIGRGLAGGVPAPAAVLQGMLRLTAARRLDDVQMATAKRVLEELARASEEYRRGVFSVLYDVAETKLAQGDYERDVLLVFHDVEGRLRVVRKGDDPEVELALQQWEAETRLVQNRIREMVR